MVTPAAKREVASSDRTKKLAGADTLQVALQASGLNQVKILYRPRLLSDNGPSLMSSELADWLKDNGIGHIRGRLAAYDVAINVASFGRATLVQRFFA
jgi:transposase InsO family protein